MTTRNTHDTHAARQASLIADRHGLSTVEYVIILLLIAVFAIGAWSKLGEKLQAKIYQAADEIENLQPPGGEH